MLSLIGPWFRFPELSTRNTGRALAREICYFNGKDEVTGKAPTWVIDYRGDQFSAEYEYEIDNRLLNHAIQLPIPGDYNAEPSPEILDFLRQWGPIGQVYQHITREQLFKELDHRPIVDRREVFFQTNKVIQENSQEHWLYCEVIGMNPPRSLLFSGYSEFWHLILLELQRFKSVFFSCSKQNNIEPLNYQLRGVWSNPSIIISGPRRQLKFEYHTLIEALYILLAKEVLGGAEFVICQKCGRDFNRSDSNRRLYCSDDCAGNASEESRKKDIPKERRRLRSMAQYRLEIKEISVDLYERIKQELKDANTLETLKEVEKKHPRVFELKRKGRKPNG